MSEIWKGVIVPLIKEHDGPVMLYETENPDGVVSRVYIQDGKLFVELDTDEELLICEYILEEEVTEETLREWGARGYSTSFFNRRIRLDRGVTSLGRSEE